jgi:hypothetical protein
MFSLELAKDISSKKVKIQLPNRKIISIIYLMFLMRLQIQAVRLVAV